MVKEIIMNSKFLKIDEEKCIHCAKCVKDCVAGNLELNEQKIPQWTKDGENRCIKCQHCFAICPTGALSILNKNPQDADSILEFDDENILNLIKSRRSIRYYKQQNIDSTKMNKLKDMLKWTPTGCNFHELHFSIIDDIEVMNDFRNTVNSRIIKSLKIKPINKLLNKFSKYRDAFINGEDVIFRNAPHMIVVSTPISAPCANIDPIIALSYFELYAQSMGLGTCWCGLGEFCLLNMPELSKTLQIPTGYKAGYMMLFGEPQIKYSRTVQPQEVEIVSVK